MLSFSSPLKPVDDMPTLRCNKLQTQFLIPLEFITIQQGHDRESASWPISCAFDLRDCRLELILVLDLGYAFAESWVVGAGSVKGHCHRGIRNRLEANWRFVVDAEELEVAFELRDWRILFLL